MLDGISASIDRSLYADLVWGVDGHLDVLAVYLFNDCRKFRDCQILIRGDLDHIDILERVPPHGLPGLVCPVYQQKFLLQDRVGESRIKVPSVSTSYDQFASGKIGRAHV